MINWLNEWWCHDKQRIDGYALRQQLFESDHKSAFSNKSAKLPDHLREKNYLIQDYPKLVTTTYADLMFGQPPVISQPGQQKYIDHLVRSNQLVTTWYEAELSVSFRGDQVYKVSILPERPGGQLRVYIEEYPAYSYFAELDPDNLRRVLSHCLAWELVAGEKRYLRVEHHEPGLIVNELFELEGLTKVKRQVPLSFIYGDRAPAEQIDTRVPFSLLLHGPNLRHCGRYFGQSDYTEGLISLFDEANQRLTSLASILDRHSDPKLILPAGSVGRKSAVAVQDMEWFEVNPEDAATGAPRYLTWDAQLTACFEQLELIDAKIFDYSDISPAMFGRDKAGNIESGRAMLMRFARMLTRAGRKALYREPIMQQAIFLGMHLAAAWRSNLSPEWSDWPEPSGHCEVIWRNGLPRDDRELTEVATAQVAARLLSRHDAIRYIRQVGDVEADAILARIDEDEKKSSAGDSEIDQETPIAVEPEEETDGISTPDPS